MTTTTPQAKFAWIMAKNDGYHDGYARTFPKQDTPDFICHAQYMAGYHQGQEDAYWLAMDEFGLTDRDYELAGVTDRTEATDESDQHDSTPHTDDWLDASEAPRYGF